MILCKCGRPLHYNDPNVQAQVQELIDRLGPNIPVKVGDRTFLVQRHYIALHGIKGAEVAELGFEEVFDGQEERTGGD